MLKQKKRYIHASDLPAKKLKPILNDKFQRVYHKHFYEHQLKMDIGLEIRFNRTDE